MHRYGLIALALTVAPAVHAETAPPTPPKWTAAAMGTLSKIDGQNSQPAINLAMTRAIDKGFIGLSVSVTDTNNDQSPPGISPTRIEILSLSTGHQLGRFMFEAHVAAGRGVFQQGMLQLAPTQNFEVASKATGYGLGGSVSSNVSLAKNLVFTPRLAIDFSATRVNRYPVDSAAWPDQSELKSDGFTFSGGGALQTRFGKSHQHGFSLMATVLRTTNTADFIHRPRDSDPIDMKEMSSDTLMDYGASISLSISDKVGLNISVSRSTGSKGPESSVKGVGLQVAY